MNVSQASVDSVISNRQLRVIQSELMQNRRMDIVHLSRSIAFQRLVSPLIALAMSDAPFDSSATQPICEDKRVVIATLACL